MIHNRDVGGCSAQVLASPHRSPRSRASASGSCLGEEQPELWFAVHRVDGRIEVEGGDLGAFVATRVDPAHTSPHLARRDANPTSRLVDRAASQEVAHQDAPVARAKSADQRDQDLPRWIGLSRSRWQGGRL